jgi:anti-sigma B factor antagonist
MTGRDLPFPFRCEVTPERDRVRIGLSGELDMESVEQVRGAVTELLRSGFDRFVVDLSELSFIDSSGLSLMLELGAGNFELELVPGPPAVQKIFRITGTLEMLPFRASPAPPHRSFPGDKLSRDP